MSTITVRFLESISSAAGSFGQGTVEEIPANIAKPWLKSGQVEFADEAEKKRVEALDASAKAPTEPKKGEPKKESEKAPVADKSESFD